MESEYVPMELVHRAEDVGFPVVSYSELTRIRIEQLERWIWKEHRELFPLVSVTWWMPENRWVFGLMAWDLTYSYTGTFDDPLTARLAGVERVIEILEESKKQKSSVVKNTNDEFEEE